MISFFLFLMLIVIVLLLALALEKIISIIHTNKIIRKKNFILIMISFLVIWITVCIIIISSAGLSHSAKMIHLVPPKCALLFLILVGLPGISMLLLHYRNIFKKSASLKIKMISIFIFSILISFIFYFTAESGMWPPLAVSSRYNCNYSSRILVNLGFDVNETDALGCAPILYTTRNGDLATTKLLLEKGADLKKWGIASLCEASINGHPDLAELLINRGIDVNSIVYDYPEWTVLMAATNAGQLDVVKMLIRKGALLNIYDKNGKTALMIAEEKGQFQIAEFLKSQKLTE